MKHLPILLLSSALLVACGGAATLSSAKDQAATVRMNGGANAGSDVSDITTRPNPPIHHVGTTQNKAVTPQSPAAAPPPALGSATDRCGSGMAASSAGNGARTTAPPKHRPLPMCAVE
jgi:hypothetical protein